MRLGRSSGAPQILQVLERRQIPAILLHFESIRTLLTRGDPDPLRLTVGIVECCG